MTRSRPRGRGLAFLYSVPFSLLGMACGTIYPVGHASNAIARSDDPERIDWPAQYQPEHATFFVHNEIEIAASPEEVWDILVGAESWPDWYEGAIGVKVRDSETGRLEPGAVFDWSTMGLDFASVVCEFERPYRLAWESRKSVIKGYHAWLIVPTETGCRVVTDESQFGFLAAMQSMFMRDKLRGLHDVWLAGIRSKAEAGAP